MTQFRQKQARSELKTLQNLLTTVNKWIFAGDNMEEDRLKLESCIEQCLDMKHFFIQDKNCMQ